MRLFFVAVTVFIASCASSHKNEDGVNIFGGGISVFDLGGDKYHIVAETNVSPVEAIETAITMWSDAASETCSGGRFVEENVEVYSYEPRKPYLFIPYIISGKRGDVICLEKYSD